MMPESQPRVSLADLRGENVVITEQGRKVVRLAGGEKLSPLQVARAGKQAPTRKTFFSKVKNLQLVRDPGGKHIVGHQVVIQRPTIVRFQGQVHVAVDAAEEEWLLKHSEFRHRFWEKTEYLDMITAEKRKMVDDEKLHRQLLEMELSGNVPERDRDLLAGMKPETDGPVAPSGDLDLPVESGAGDGED